MAKKNKVRFVWVGTPFGAFALTSEVMGKCRGKKGGRLLCEVSQTLSAKVERLKSHHMEAELRKRLGIKEQIPWEEYLDWYAAQVDTLSVALSESKVTLAAEKSVRAGWRLDEFTKAIAENIVGEDPHFNREEIYPRSPR